jgi:lipoprotein-releasing system ATP-binding protein
MTNILLQCMGIAKSYQDGNNEVNVLSHLNLTLNSHELLAITGRSGSGKSTLLHILGTLDKPSSGRVIFKGQDIHHLNASKQATFRNNELGFIYQFHHLLAEFSALENIMMPLLIAGINKSESQRRALTMLKQVGLKDRAHHKPSQLSGGERQRIAIARALVNEPSLVLADEPTGNLDSENAQAIFELLRELRDKKGTSFVVVTHDNHLANKLDRVVNLSSGQLNNNEAAIA